MRRGSATVEQLQKILPHGLSRRLAVSHDNVRDERYGDREVLSRFSSNSNWVSVQGALMTLFRQEKVTSLEATMLCQNMRVLRSTDIGSFIFEHYKACLLPKGMEAIFNNAIKNRSPLHGLVNVWNGFYRETLPVLESIFLSVHIRVTDIKFKDATLLAFRDHVLLKLNTEKFRESLKHLTDEQQRYLTQICLVLQNIKEEKTLTENALELEKLTALVVSPFFGRSGYYEGSSEPVIPSPQLLLMKKKDNEETEEAPGDIQLPSSQLERIKRMASLNSSWSSLVTDSPQRTRHREQRRHSVHFGATVRH